MKMGLDSVNRTWDHLKANVVQDVYVLTDDSFNKCYDICVMILKNSVRFREEIAPGIKLENLNVINPSVDSDWPHHIETSLNLNEWPIIVGYGYMGIDNIGRNLQVPGQFMRHFLGRNIKKAIRLRVLDLNSLGIDMNIIGFRCKELHLEEDKQVKLYLEKARQAKMLEKFYVEDHAHLGFSGSLTFKKGQTGGYDVYGIYSGPLFMQEIKIFIENAAVYQAQTVEPDQKMML
jgi:hypothetical protein